ncbi:MAG TPA: hypothetical protein VEY91_08540 [Candidatus Limnocylindria bacterium]|nr:hypothetical protein [Candidatus Limnocylindria bacterium]
MLGLALFLLTGFTIAMGLAFAVWAWRSRRRTMGCLALIGVLAAGALYASALLVVSAQSETRWLPPGEIKRFCGFYLDCHVGVAVKAVRWAKQLGGAGPTADGRFAVVTLEVSSDASRVTLGPAKLEAVIVDSRGRRYARALEAERRLGANTGAVAGLEEQVPAGGSYRRELVFDVPESATAPLGLLVTDGLPPDTWIESVLVDDDDSLFHQPTLLRLPG